MIGLAVAWRGQCAQGAQEGRRAASVAMSIKDHKDPRTADWLELANARAPDARAAGQLHPRIHLRARSCWRAGKSTTTPPSMSSTSARASPGPMATPSTPTTSIYNFNRWCDKDAPKAIRWPAPRRRADRRGHRQARKTAPIDQGRRQHGEAEAQRAGHLADPELHRLSGAGRASQLRRDEREFVQNPIGTGAFELVSYDVGSKAVVTSAARTASGGAARRCSTASSSSTTAPISRPTVSAFEAGEVHTNYETTGRLRDDPRRRSACSDVGGGDRDDAGGAHQRGQQAL